MCGPVGVAVDGAGNLYVGDASNHRVLEYDTPLASDTTADRVFGQGGTFESERVRVHLVDRQDLRRDAIGVLRLDDAVEVAGGIADDTTE